MSKFMLRKLHNFFQTRPFSSNQTSFTVNYLINSCGLTLENAVSASKHVKFKAADKPDSVLAFFKDHGFSQTQISKLINHYPKVLKCNPENTLLPKLEFLKSTGISGSDIVSFASNYSAIFRRSLENCLVPTYEFLSNFLNSKENINTAFKRFLGFSKSFPNICIKSNLEMLKQAGVPVSKIRYLVTTQPRVLLTDCQESIEEVKKMGFDPLELSFLKAVHALKSMKKVSWNRKIEVYKRWGWSDDDFVRAFTKSPYCMGLSENKIDSVMEYLLNKRGLKSSFISQRPHILLYSLEKRIIPRCVVYEKLVSKGLIKPTDIGLTTMIHHSEKCFIEKIKEINDDEAPALLKLYKQK